MIDSAAADRLASIPLFAGVGADHVRGLAARAVPVRLEAGRWLFHQGDPGDSLYVIEAGSVDVVAEEPEPIVVRILGRGETLGELALLTGEPRSLGARAHRDTQLLRVAREDFDSLLLAEPAFGLALTRVLGARLRDVRPTERATAPPRTIALLPLHGGAPVAAVAEHLIGALLRLGRVARLDGGEVPMLEMLERMETDNDHVLLVATAVAVDDPWTAYCLRQSDRVVALASLPEERRSRTPVQERLRGCDLAFSAQRGVEPALDGWMDALAPRTVHVLRGDAQDGAGRMARRLAGHSLGVVLSGGGARGMAHIGVIEELQRAGFHVDRIGGASIGAMVGALFAEDRTADQVADVMEAEYVRSTPLSGRTLPLLALSRGVRGFAMQHRVHGTRRIEGLDVNFFCVSADLAAQRLVVHRSGLVAVAVSASQALPGFVPPVKDGDRVLVDGAILSNLPVQPMLAMGEGPVVAVDVTGGMPPPRPLRTRLSFAHRLIAGPAAEWAPVITETVLRSILLGNASSDAAARDLADLVIRPALRGVPTMRFRDLDRVRRLGRDAARASIEAGAFNALGLPRSK